MTPPAPRYRYSSPPPVANKSINQTRRSPPPPPHHFATRSGVASEPTSDSVWREINSGHSVLEPEPTDIFHASLARSEFYKSVGGGGEDRRSVRPNIHRGFVLVSPYSSHFHSPSSAADLLDEGGDSEDLEDDMPLMSFPIRLAMRTGRSPIAPRPSNATPERSFRPIQPFLDDAGFGQGQRDG
ncbi:hypothetical protein ACHAWF_015840 [Thalassiosira exigua]